MTIASEITRLQWVRSDIRNSIIEKWVEVPSGAKYEDMPWYIGQIQQGKSWYELFTPASVVVDNAVWDKYGSYMYESLWDTVSPDWGTYYHYCWYREDSSSAYETYKVGVLTKQALSNPGFTWWLTSIDERNVHYLTRVRSKRMKKAGNDVIFSLLYSEEYDSDWHSTSWRSETWYCVNITNTTSTTVNLWTISADSWWQYSQEDIDSIYTAWETSCWMASSEVLPSIGLTSLSLTSGTGNNYRAVTATLIV